jgi:signal transduction histidine kinase
VRAANLLHTTSFRLTLFYAGLFAASVLVLFGVIYGMTAVYLGSQLDSIVDTELATLEDRFRDAGSVGLAGSIRERIGFPSNRFAYYLLQDSAGRRLAGNLPPLPPETGWHDLWTVSDSGGDQRRHVRGQGAILGDGTYLFVAQDYEQLDEFRELIASAFSVSAGITLALALVGGAIMSRALLRRVEAVNTTSELIMAGDLGRRIPVRGTGDEFDRLASNLNAMLERIERLMEGLRQVSNDIAHDLRTPLTRLRQNLDAARRHSRSAPSLEAAMDRAVEETDAILAIFGALLRIAQIEAGTRRAGFTRVDLSAVLETVLEVYGPAAEEKSQTLLGDARAGTAIVGDRELLTQMVANLVENAIRHASEGGRIEASLAVAEDRVQLVVADDGPGIPEAAREKVFQRFYRLEQARTTPGSGLGLSLVAAVADLHGMTVRLLDNHPGLRVVVEMPISSGQTTERR